MIFSPFPQTESLFTGERLKRGILQNGLITRSIFVYLLDGSMQAWGGGGGGGSVFTAYILHSYVSELIDYDKTIKLTSS